MRPHERRQGARLLLPAAAPHLSAHPAPPPCHPLPALTLQILSHPIFARLVEAATRRAPEMSDAELAGGSNHCWPSAACAAAVLAGLHCADAEPANANQGWPCTHRALPAAHASGACRGRCGLHEPALRPKRARRAGVLASLSQPATAHPPTSGARTRRHSLRFERNRPRAAAAPLSAPERSSRRGPEHALSHPAHNSFWGHTPAPLR